MDLEPGISVVIACYNSGVHIGQAIDSVLAQTCRPLEVLVVDDGSTDNSAALARRYGSPVRVLGQSNQGPCAARNLGIREARGRYLHFLDADDLLHPRAYQWLVEAMQGREDRLAVMGWRFFEKAPLEEGQLDHLPSRQAVGLRYLVGENLAPIHAILAPTGLVRQTGGFDDSISFCEDWYVWTRVVLAGAEVVTIGHAGAYYRLHPGCRSRDAGKMLAARTELLLRTHGEVVVRPELLRSVGDALLEAESRVRRRYYARGLESPAPLEAAIRELRGRGFRRNRSSGQRALDALFGLRADYLVMNAYRWFKPAVFAFYKEGYE